MAVTTFVLTALSSGPSHTAVAKLAKGDLEVELKQLDPRHGKHVFFCRHVLVKF